MNVMTLKIEMIGRENGEWRIIEGWTSTELSQFRQAIEFLSSLSAGELSSKKTRVSKFVE